MRVRGGAGSWMRQPPDSKCRQHCQKKERAGRISKLLPTQRGVPMCCSIGTFLLDPLILQHWCPTKLKELSGFWWTLLALVVEFAGFVWNLMDL